ncbi:glycosyl transferase [Treponema pedis]|uniref:glycosyl transferase n=1 Tax=Treponema pedis TaxID=409322 RepID=UPI00056FC83A|nr:glycosyl transferase [Treponema pedis]
MIITLMCISFLFSGCATTLRDMFFGKEDTSINWEMVELQKAPQMNKLEKLSATSKERMAVFRYAERAHAEDKKWYKVTAPEKAGEEYYVYKILTANGAIWEVYKKK